MNSNPTPEPFPRPPIPGPPAPVPPEPLPPNPGPEQAAFHFNVFYVSLLNDIQETGGFIRSHSSLNPFFYCMKIFLYSAIAGALMTSTLPAQTSDQDKSTGDRVSDAWDATKQTTKKVARKVANTTTNAAHAVVETVTPDKDARRVEVTLARDNLDMPKTIKAGKTAFVVKNSANEKQDFEITGEGIEREFVFALSPGETKTLQVTLEPGKYKAYCTAKDHKTHRMTVNLTVR